MFKGNSQNTDRILRWCSSELYYATDHLNIEKTGSLYKIHSMHSEIFAL